MGSSRLSRSTSSGSRPVATFRRRFSRAMPPDGLGLAGRVDSGCTVQASGAERLVHRSQPTEVGRRLGGARDDAVSDVCAAQGLARRGTIGIQAAQVASGPWPIRRSSRRTSRRRRPWSATTFGWSRSARSTTTPTMQPGRRASPMSARPPASPTATGRRRRACRSHGTSTTSAATRRLRSPHWVHVHRPRAGHGRRDRVRLPLPLGVAGRRRHGPIVGAGQPRRARRPARRRRRRMAGRRVAVGARAPPRPLSAAELSGDPCLRPTGRSGG